MHATWAVLLIVAIPLAGCVQDADQPGTEPAAPAVDDPVGPGPAWSFTDTDGVAHSRETSVDDPTVIFFMASWCSSCQRLTQELNKVQPDYVDEGVDFYSVSWDPSDDDESLEAWKERFDQPWPHGVDPDFEMQRTFGVRSQSTVIVLDSVGNKVHHFGYGEANAENLPRVLDDILERDATAQA